MGDLPLTNGSTHRLAPSVVLALAAAHYARTDVALMLAHFERRSCSESGDDGEDDPGGWPVI